MLHQISWTTYFESLIVLLAIYYAATGFKFYGRDISVFIQTRILKNSPQSRSQIPFFAQEPFADTEEEFEASFPETGPVAFEENYYEAPDDSITERETIIARIKAAINETASRPYNPPALTSKIKAIFMDYPSVKNSPYRDAINELIVTECERTGTALLTEDEVDRW
jgi:hypothetical protein